MHPRSSNFSPRAVCVLPLGEGIMRGFKENTQSSMGLFIARVSHPRLDHRPPRGERGFRIQELVNLTEDSHPGRSNWLTLCAHRCSGGNSHFGCCVRRGKITASSRLCPSLGPKSFRIRHKTQGKSSLPRPKPRARGHNLSKGKPLASN